MRYYYSAFVYCTLCVDLFLQSKDCFAHQSLSVLSLLEFCDFIGVPQNDCYNLKKSFHSSTSKETKFLYGTMNYASMSDAINEIVLIHNTIMLICYLTLDTSKSSPRSAPRVKAMSIVPTRKFCASWTSICIFSCKLPVSSYHLPSHWRSSLVSPAIFPLCSRKFSRHQISFDGPISPLSATSGPPMHKAERANPERPKYTFHRPKTSLNMFDFEFICLCWVEKSFRDVKISTRSY